MSYNKKLVYMLVACMLSLLIASLHYNYIKRRDYSSASQAGEQKTLHTN